jgi:hypothetical protein
MSKNITKSKNRKWMSDLPEIESKGIWDHVSMIYAKKSWGCEK